MIYYNSNTINDWNFGDDNIIKVYRNGAVCYYKISGGGDTPQYKLVAHYSDGTVYKVAYDGNDSLTQAEVRGHTSSFHLMTSAEIGDTVASIDNNAFNNCNTLTSVTIPDSVTSIGSYAFLSCYSLTSLTIPSGVTSINSTAFNECSGLTSITVDSSNTVYDSRDNCNAIIQTSSNGLVVGCKNTVIPNTVTNIGNYAFKGCRDLASITIPSGVTSIGDNAFQYCTSLVNVHFQRTTAPNIVSTTFNSCTALAKIYIPTCDSVDSYAASAGLSSYTNKIYAENDTQCTVTDYSKQPFTIVAKAAGSFKFTKNSSATFRDMQFSTNGGSSWSNYASGSIKSLSAGGKLMFRFVQSGGNNGVGTISGSSNYEVEGNVRSLWASAGFTGSTTQVYNYQLANLFSGQTMLLSAENLVLPSTTLKNNCYQGMFFGCTNLTTAPELPAATLVSNCYNQMFRSCSKLNNIRCYATNISASNCTRYWTNGVASSGTFTKASSMTGWSKGQSGIPRNWTIKNKS